MNTVFFDVDTQLDFLYPAGALYVPGAERIVERVAGLNRHAASRGIPVVSTMDAHAEDDPEFRSWPPHCIAGTWGQRKPESTLLDKRVVVPASPTEASIGGAAQVIVEKVTTDCFTNPNLPALLERLGADAYVVYGVVTEVCVRNAVLGLLKTGKPVMVVRDAVQELSPDEAARFFAELQALGGKLTTMEEVRATM